MLDTCSHGKHASWAGVGLLGFGFGLGLRLGRIRDGLGRIRDEVGVETG